MLQPVACHVEGGQLFLVFDAEAVTLQDALDDLLPVYSNQDELLRFEHEAGLAQQAQAQAELQCAGVCAPTAGKPARLF